MDIVSSNKVCLVKLSTQKIYYLLGAVGDLFFIIRSGEVRVTKNNDDGSENEVAVLGAGDFFGDKALIKEEKRSANIYAKSDLKCYTLDRTAFINLVGRVTDQDDPNKQAAPEVTLTIIDDFQNSKKNLGRSCFANKSYKRELGKLQVRGFGNHQTTWCWWIWFSQIG